MRIEEERNLDRMVEWVQNLFKFKHFYDQMDFSLKQRLAINKSIVELTDLSKSCELVEKRSIRDSRFCGDAVVFTKTISDLPSGYDRPFYVIATVNGIELNRALLDSGYSINIISLAVLDAVGIAREKITGKPIEVYIFRGHKTFTVGFANLDLTVSPIRVAHMFHVINSQTSYCLLLRRPWIHYHKVVPSTHLQCLKAIRKWKRVHVNAMESLF